MLWWTARSRHLHYSVSMTITKEMQDVIIKVLADSRIPTYDSDRQMKDGHE